MSGVETSLSGNSVLKKVVNFHGESVIPGTDSSGVGQVEQSRLIRGETRYSDEWNFPDAINQCSLRRRSGECLLIFAENIVPAGPGVRHVLEETLRGPRPFSLLPDATNAAFDPGQWD